jgi:DNA-binding MarR family transcriptional regulator
VKKKKSAPRRGKRAPSPKKKRVARSSGGRSRFVPANVFSIENILKEEQEKKTGTGLSKVSVTDTTDYGKLFQIFNLMRSKQQELTVQQLSVLFYLGHVNAMRPTEGITMMAISQDLNFAGHSSVSRVCQRLGEGFKYKTPGGEERVRDGLGFISLELHPRDPRQKVVVLTAEGRKFATSVYELMKRNFVTLN